jgi:RNA polymerase sigma-70 factor (ECF subfamily)
MDDRELAAAARRGDEDAFAALVRRHSPGLHRTVARVVSDEAEGWDVVQMAFLKAWQRLDRYNPRWSFATWLYRIGTNLAIDLLRSRDSRQRMHQAVVDQGPRPVRHADHPGGRVERLEVETIFGRLSGSLTPQQRAAFVLREVEGLDTAEVATIIGCSPTTVRNHVFQARKVLRREIGRQFPEYLPASRRG